jgi:hypothetical protein
MATSMAYVTVTKLAVNCVPTADWPIFTFWPD